LKVAEKKEKKEGIEVCPLCDSKMEKGFYMVPRQTWWDTKKHKWTAGGSEQINPFSWTLTNFESHRCKKCKLIIFQYGETANSTEDLP